MIVYIENDRGKIQVYYNTYKNKKETTKLNKVINML